MSQEAIAYDKHKNLKLAAADIGIKWQTLYARLKNQGVKVVGDKLKYGSDRDRLSTLAELEFLRFVPSAISMNSIKWQHKYDFEVNGHKVDVKCSMPKKLSKSSDSESWSFSFKKQSLICDFVCCFGLNNSRETEKIILVPSEFFKGLQTVSVSINGNSKWMDYEIKGDELESFFFSM